MVPVAGGHAPGDPVDGPGVRRAGRGATSSSSPLGWAASRRPGRPVPTALRALTWAVAFAVGFVVTAVVLRALGVLGVNTAIDLYVGSGLHRFGVLLVMLPLWAVLSATMAHFSLEALAARRRRESPTANTSTPA